MLREGEYVRIWHCNRCNKDFETNIRKAGSICTHCENTIDNDGIDLKGFRSQDGTLKTVEEICDHAGYACDCCHKPICEWRLDEPEPDPHDIIGGQHDWFFEDGEYVCTVPGCAVTKRLYDQMLRE